tara:strand:- start:739 stop:1257 length:519 start_codon:yes stop_codon:yes gene_type:complete
MVTRIFGWILIFVQFFIIGQLKEQVIAVQTIFCAATIGKLKPYHVATLALVASLGVEPSPIDMVAFILLHVTIFSAVYMEYNNPRLKTAVWVAVAWTIRWLSYNAFYESSVRSSFKCILYIISANLRQKYLNGNYYKCVWILMVHEICWVLIPIQLMREIYQKNKKEETCIV